MLYNFASGSFPSTIKHFTSASIHILLAVVWTNPHLLESYQVTLK